jgi:CheY-like chemotaxis protein
MNGMDGFVAKPISIPVLLRAIEDALHGPEQSVSGYAPPRAAAGI